MSSKDDNTARLQLGVCYYPEQWDPNLWAEDARRMVDLGLDWVRIGEFTWAEVEPERGTFNWGLLDKAVEVLGSAGLKVMMGTPTAAPPKWLVDELPETLPYDIHGRPRKFGSRRHYSFSSVRYRAEAERITRAFGKRYGANPHVQAWQIDNEYGDHDTILDFGPEAARGFRAWLEVRYGKIDALNAAWGTSFWAQRYHAFSKIDPPVGQLEEPNPAHALDFRHYSSDQVANFHKAMVAALRPYIGDAPLTHNFMANSYDFDHYPLSQDIDFASWDSYPMGQLIEGGWNAEERARYLRSGHPDYQAFHTELYRNVGQGRVWITEQQPGPVNWASYNQAPADGMIRNFTWAAYAHGAEAVLFFRWRQALRAHEQNHTALLLPDGTPDQAFHEVKMVVAERDALPALPPPAQAEVALVVDYPSRWAKQILPQGRREEDALDSLRWFEAVRQNGLAVDVVSADQPLNGYKLVLCPDQMIMTQTFVDHVKAAGCKLLVNARAGSKTEEMAHPANLAPGPLQNLISLRVTRVESLPPNLPETVLFGNETYKTTHWREHVETDQESLATFSGPYRSGSPALIGNETCRYVAFHPVGEVLRKITRHTLIWAGVAPQPWARDLRLMRRGDLCFAINSGPEPVTVALEDQARMLVGGSEIAPYSLAIWRE